LRRFRQQYVKSAALFHLTRQPASFSAAANEQIGAHRSLNRTARILGECEALQQSAIR
jgi:hypothetical protein